MAVMDKEVHLECKVKQDKLEQGVLLVYL